MPLSSTCPALIVITGGLAMSSCGGSVPSTSLSVADSALAPAAKVASPADNTSILKKLTKDVVIGSTVDLTNADEGPRAISVVKYSYGVLKKGQLLVCNFEDSSGEAGKGTTIEALDPAPGSKPATFTQGGKINGCDGDAIYSGNQVYGAGLTSHLVSQFTQTGKFKTSYGPPIEVPFGDADAYCGENYAPEDIYVADSKTGSIIKLAFPVSSSGHPQVIQVITGFGVNKNSGWAVLGPSGMQYNGKRRRGRCNDTLYIVDGVDDTVVAVSNASELLVKDEIIVQPGGKTFKCKFSTTTCGALVYSGKPLDAPVAMTLLPNGNLIVANTQGGNKLVELTPAGQVLDTKVVDKSKTASVFGLAAIGTNDTNTALYYTDTNDNSLHELEQ